MLRNLNKFYTDQNEKRKGLFERKNYCDPSDYEVLGGQEEPPSHITVTHTLPLATNINNFLLPSVTSVQLIAVGDLRLVHNVDYQSNNCRVFYCILITSGPQTSRTRP